MNHVIQKAISLAGSQANLAKAIGVGQSTISMILTRHFRTAFVS